LLRVYADVRELLVITIIISAGIKQIIPAQASITYKVAAVKRKTKRAMSEATSAGC
jgi:hypothetical protein